MSRPLPPGVRHRVVLVGSLLAALAAASGCGQTGPLALPDSAQPPRPETSAPSPDEDDTESTEEERSENER